MQSILDIGSHAYIIESNRIITEVIISSRRGDFYTVRFPERGAIQLRRNRLFLTEEEAKQHVHVNKPARRFHSPYDYGRF